jgi:hypothetical protein
VTSTEIAKLLETFRKRFTPDVEIIAPETVRLWNEQFRDIHRDVMRAAVKAYLAAPPAEAFPKPAALRWFIREASKAATGNTEPSPGKPAAPPTVQDGSCPGGCDRGRRESSIVETAVASRPSIGEHRKLDGPPEPYEFAYPPAVYPCPTCDPGGYDRWHDQWVPEARRMRPVRSTDLLDYNPTEKLREARALNATLPTLTKDPNDL